MSFENGELVKPSSMQHCHDQREAFAILVVLAHLHGCARAWLLETPLTADIDKAQCRLPHLSETGRISRHFLRRGSSQGPKNF